MKLLGLSSSPIPNSNTDEAVKAVLAASGQKSEFIKLSELEMTPCRACLGCKETNTCVVKDDARELAAKFRDADAFVLGVYTPYCSLDARAKMFMERMYCLRHQTGLNQGKIGALVITTACPPEIPGMPPAAQTAEQQIGFWMMEEGMTKLGTLVVAGNVPCVRCGHGDDCAHSGIKMLHGPNATVESVGVNRFPADKARLAQAHALGQQLAEALAARA